MIEPQAASLPSRDQNHADLPGRQSLATSLAGLSRRKPILCGVKPKGGGLTRARGQVAEIALILPLQKELLHQREIDALNLPGERLALAVGKY
jgi:hypothetical protein